MIHIQKKEEPEFLTEYKQKNPSATYDTYSFKAYHSLLREKLVKEQKGLCAYCCSKITTETSHNEHIEPRHMKNGAASKRSLDYGNLVASCNSGSTCGIHKSNEYDPAKFVSPIDEECERAFSYDPDGYMNGDEYTISLLNLNSYELMRARNAVYKMLLKMKTDDIRLIYCSDDEQYFPYSNVIFWYLKENERML